MYQKSGFPGWAAKELKQAGYNPQNVMDAYIPEWWGWYTATAAWFADDASPYKRKMTLHPARKVCDEFELLMLDGDLSVSCESGPAGAAEWLEGSAPALIGSLWGFVSRYMALGTGALAIDISGVSEGASEGARATVRTFDADEVCPLVCDAHGAASAAMCRRVVVGAREYDMLQVHEPRGGQYAVLTWMYERGGTEAPRRVHVDGVAEEVLTGCPLPTFALVRPAVPNELEPNTPLGASVFEACVPQLMDVDAKYDDWHWSPRLCRPRVAVDERGLVVDPKTGQYEFGSTIDKMLYRALGAGGDSAVPVTVVAPDPRIQQLEQALSAALGVLGDRVGFGPNYFRFNAAENGGLYKTATEVASGNQRLMRAVQRHEGVLGAAIESVLAAAFLCERALRGGAPVGADQAPRFAVHWDDSIMEDDAAKRAAMKDDIARGLCPAWLYPMEYYGMTEAQAKAFVAGGDAPEGDGEEF